MATVNITPSRKKKPLKINYGDGQYVVSTRVPLELVTAQDSVPRPKVMAGSQKQAYTEQVGVAVIAAFCDHVLPEDFKAVLDLNDVPAVFDAWSEASDWGKSPSSGNSTGASRDRLSSNSDAEDSE